MNLMNASPSALSQGLLELINSLPGVTQGLGNVQVRTHIAPDTEDTVFVVSFAGPGNATNAHAFRAHCAVLGLRFGDGNSVRLSLKDVVNLIDAGVPKLAAPLSEPALPVFLSINVQGNIHESTGAVAGFKCRDLVFQFVPISGNGSIVVFRVPAEREDEVRAELGLRPRLDPTTDPVCQSMVRDNLNG